MKLLYESLTLEMIFVIFLFLPFFLFLWRVLHEFFDLFCFVCITFTQLEFGLFVLPVIVFGPDNHGRISLQSSLSLRNKSLSSSNEALQYNPFYRVYNLWSNYTRETFFLKWILHDLKMYFKILNIPTTGPMKK